MPVLFFKDGVQIGGLHSEIRKAVDIAKDVFAKYDKDCVVTSGREGKHMDYSLHYAGQAVDLRRRHLNQEEAEQIREALIIILGEDYTVLLEATHFHVHYRPKESPV